MTDVPEEPPIVRLTRWQVGLSTTDLGKKTRLETERWTYFGVDANGEERIYAEHTSDEEHAAWEAADPLWKEAQRALFDHVLADLRTRDTVLRINVQAALGKGDRETAVILMRAFSPATLHKIMRFADQ